ncbi:hypothetical protein [Pseudomonas syringae]|uniref:hypothetical protein n=1 Tax=Pseudomonas syringae TaxID=317 RepID=UPI000ACF0717|nr:hypothetical protein [Pseudomonas syringae]
MLTFCYHLAAAIEMEFLALMTVYTTAAATNVPCTHALVIGVSRYLHLSGGESTSDFGRELEMAQLTSAARSASDFAAWLIDSYRNSSAPLSSVRILLSPNFEAEEEVNANIKGMLTASSEATRGNAELYFDQFSTSLAKHTENVGVVYFAGHGVQLTKTGAILLLSDVGDPAHPTELHGSLDLMSLHKSASHPGTAQTQFWFADVCRQEPKVAKQFEYMVGSMQRSKKNGHAKSSTMFLSSISGAKAYGRPDGVTLFNEALMNGLVSGEAAQSDGEDESPWEVTATSLIEYLSSTVPKKARAAGAEQFVENTGIIENGVLHSMIAAPTVEFEADVSPQAHRGHCTNFNLRSSSCTHVDSNSDWPFSTFLPAGLYSAAWNTSLSSATSQRQALLNVRPPKKVLSVKP